MSAKNIVNPDHYKIAGRDRPNETVVPEVEKKKMVAQVEQDEVRKARRRKPAVAAASDARPAKKKGL